jgi:hypothetical protein
MYDSNIKEKIKSSNEKEKDINNINTKNQNQISIREKKIFIHKPSDFLKNKYPFFGNLSNNKDFLRMDSRKTYQSHKFNMKDFKQQMKKSNRIIESIIKDGTKVLPNLLKNYHYQNNQNDNYNIKSMNISNMNKFLYYDSKYNNSSNVFTKSKYDTMNNKNGLNNINQKSDRLVNLKFFVNSPKRKNIIDRNNPSLYPYQLHGILDNKNIKPNKY